MRPPTSPPFSMLYRQSPLPSRSPFQCSPPVTRCRTYSNPPIAPVIKVQNIPAPHTGFITILSLASHANKNAISRQLLRELTDNIAVVYNQWDTFTGRTRTLGARMRKKGDAGSKERESAIGESSIKSTHDLDSSSTAGGALTPRDLPNSTRVLILSSEIEKVFCAGADLKERAGMNHQETNQFLNGLRAALSRISNLPIPTISAISGFALGGGLEIALATTFRVLSSNATVGLPETRLGIIPGAGGPMRLVDLIGSKKAADLILTGRRIDGREAFALGLCERLIEVNQDQAEKPNHQEQRIDIALEAAVKMAKDICEGAPTAIGAALRVVHQGVNNVGSLQLWENLMYERVLQTEDRDEALLAFKEKRKPNFKGK